MGINAIPFDDTDKRVCSLTYSRMNLEAKVDLYQLDVLRLIRNCERYGSIALANDLKKFVKDIDELEGKHTNFDREKLPRSIIRV